MHFERLNTKDLAILGITFSTLTEENKYATASPPQYYLFRYKTSLSSKNFGQLCNQSCVIQV